MIITREAATDLLAATELLPVTTSQAYNEYKILEQFSATSDGSEYFSYTLGRDITGRITFKHEGIYREAHQWTHTYDESERVVNEVDGVVEYYLVYSDQLRPILQLDADGNVVSEFIYATRVNVPDYMLKGGHTYRIVTDHLGSVRLVVDRSTGAVAQRVDYDPWGVVLTDTNPGFQPFGFGGGLYDRHSGLVRFGARDYDSNFGRWLLRDAIFMFNSVGNNYLYLQSEAVTFTDITGLDQLWFDGGLLTWYSNTGDILGSWLAISGTLSGAIRAAEGMYEVHTPHIVVPFWEYYNSYCDKLGLCWFSRFHGSLLIHPDGNIPGTGGCIGVQNLDTSDLYILLLEYDALPNGPLILVINYQ